VVGEQAGHVAIPINRLSGVCVRVCASRRESASEKVCVCMLVHIH